MNKMVKYFQVITGWTNKDKILGYYWGDLNNYEFHWEKPEVGFFVGFVVVEEMELLQSGQFKTVSNTYHMSYTKKNGRWESPPMNYGYYGYGDDYMEEMTPYNEDENGYIIPKKFEL